MKLSCRTLGVFALSVGLLTTTSCARRLVLTPQEYERIEKREQATEDLRVYVSKKLVVQYELDEDSASYSVEKGPGDIATSSEQNLLRVIIAKNTRGKIIGAEDRNGAELLWVTFNAKCQDKDCAFGFVKTEDGVFRLHSAPDREGYQQPKVFFKNDKKPMKLGKLKSLAEKNDVYLWKNKREKIFTIDLIVKKRTTSKRKVDRERGSGVD